MSIIRMNPNTQLMNPNILHAKLSYRLMGALFKVHNELGPDYQEKYYQRSIEEELTAQGIKFEREKLIPLTFRGASIGRYFLDFLIEDKIALEVKTIEFFRKAEWRQARRYLRSAGLELGILVNFSGKRLLYKRVLNRL